MEKVLVNYKMKDNNNITEYKTIGNFEVIDDFFKLSFIEKDSNVNSTYHIYNSKLILERTGQMSMTLSFIPNETTKTIVKTDFGYNMNIEVNTLYYEFTNNEINLKYDLDIDKGNIHTLKLTYSFKKIK